MGLFDSIIGTAKANPEDPTPFVLVADEREEFVPFDATGGGGGGTGTGSGSGNGDGSGGGSGSGNGQGGGTGGTGTGNGSGWGFDGDRKEVNPLAFAHIEEPVIIEKIEEPSEVNIDIGGDMTDLVPEIPESIVITDEVASTDAINTSEISPISESDEGSGDPIVDAISTDITPIDIDSPSILDASDIADTLLSGDAPIIATTLESLDEKISGFVAELEELKADDEMLLHEKETAIEKLEGEMKDLEKEVKKIQADEKKIDSTIASLGGTTKTK